ncbi:hypothetical protein JCM10213_002929 [Rhodosporidiobolus nylandii]
MPYFPPRAPRDARAVANALHAIKAAFAFARDSPEEEKYDEWAAIYETVLSNVWPNLGSADEQAVLRELQQVREGARRTYRSVEALPTLASPAFHSIADVFVRTDASFAYYLHGIANLFIIGRPHGEVEEALGWAQEGEAVLLPEYRHASEQLRKRALEVLAAEYKHISSLPARDRAVVDLPQYDSLAHLASLAASHNLRSLAHAQPRLSLRQRAVYQRW